MEHLTIATIAVAVLAFAALSARLERGIVTAPMAFLTLGWCLGPSGAGLLGGMLHEGVLHAVAEATLVLVLFGDAARIDFGKLRRESAIPLRMLVLGLPGVIERKTAGSRLSSRAYQATPKPSPLSGSLRSRESKL